MYLRCLKRAARWWARGDRGRSAVVGATHAVDTVHSLVSRLGRVAGVIVAGAAVTLWVISLFFNPYSPDAQGGALLLGVTMILGTSVAGLAAGRGAHLGMYLLFLVLFCPVGLYVMFLPGLFQAIGWLDLAYLGCAVLIHRGGGR